MACIPSKDTRPEILLDKILRENGIRHKKHYKVAGRPDFAIIDKKIAIFVDGDFWHGHNWKLRGFKSLKVELASYKKFWANKIRNNIKRDKKANRLLRKDGWKVLRFWESNLKRRPDKIIRKILLIYKARKPAL
jgi:DNA mismatch endonuclease (patch repair protein)